MINRYKYNDLVWVDLAMPTSDEVRQIALEFGVNAAVANELTSPSLKPKVELYRDFIYLILRFPAFKHSHKETTQEIDFVVGKKFLITCRYDTVDALERFAKSFEMDSIIERVPAGHHAGHIFHRLLREIYKALSDELHHIEDATAVAEKKMFAGNEKAMVFELSRIGRQLLVFRKATMLHREVLKSFEVAARTFFGSGFEYETRAVLEEYLKIESALKNSSELLAELRDTNNTLVSTKQNEIMKTLAVIAFLVLPFTVVASFFQVNTVNMPIVGMKYDWFIVIGIMVAMTMGLFALAKKQKWF